MGERSRPILCASYKKSARFLLFFRQSAAKHPLSLACCEPKPANRGAPHLIPNPFKGGEASNRQRKPPLNRLLTLALPLAALCSYAHADLGIMPDPTNLGSTRYTSAGHSLLYLSGVCSASSIHARICQPGEHCSILTTYPNFHEAQPYS